MNKQLFNRQTPILFKRFCRKGYALFSCLGREVLVGTLAVSILTYAKANGISVRADFAADSLQHEEVKLDEVVVTGSRVPLTAMQSAKIVEVITREDIDRAQASTINDVLKMATGVDVRQRGSFGVQTDISINGGTFDQITILLNGVDISNPQTGHNAADFPVSLNDIERIEILEGASARVFGSAAFSGAVNIVTRCSNRNKVRMTAEGGSFGTWNTNGGICLGSGNVRSSLSAGYSQSDGGTENSDFRKRQLYWQGNAAWRLARLDWQAGTISKDYGANTFYSAKFNNQYEETRRYIASVKASVTPFLGIQSPLESLTLSPMIYVHRNYDHYQLTRSKTGAAAGENYHRMDVYGASLGAHLKWWGGTTAVGVDIRRENLLSTAYGEALDESDYKDIHGSDRQYIYKGVRTNTNLFAEHNIIIGGLTLSAGILAYSNSHLNDGLHVYPGIDIGWRMHDSWKVYLSWNEALRVPTYTDLYTSNSAQQGNLELKPEKTRMLKGGVEYRHGAVNVVASGFYSNGSNMIDWVYETPSSTKYHALNIGKLDNMGFTTEATLRIADIWHASPVTRVKVGYAYIYQSHETEHDIYKSLYALEYLRHKVTCTLDHRIWRQLSASWSLRWQQRMNGYHPYTKLDCKIQWSSPHYRVYVLADNITCHRYYDLGSVKQPGLWVMAGMTVDF